MAGGDSLEDLVDGLLGGDGDVEGDEVSLESLRDVIPAPTRVDHGGHVLDVWGGEDGHLS